MRQIRWLKLAQLVWLVPTAWVLGMAGCNDMAPTPAATPLGGGTGQIVFVSDRELYVMDANGSNVMRLTDCSAEKFGPAWSPDGTRIAFASSNDQEHAAIYLMNPDGSNVVQLTEQSGIAVEPTWSPNGAQIAFVSLHEGRPAIYVMNADGSEVMRFTEDDVSEAFSPVWSPDGARIAFLASRDSGNPDLYVMDTNGSSVVQLTESPESESYPDWSPDGTRIAFSSPDGIHVMNADGTNVTQLTDRALDPAWSPDGTRIAFVSRRDGTDDIFVMNADGSNIVQLTTQLGNSTEPTWGWPSGQATVRLPIRPTNTLSFTTTPTKTPSPIATTTPSPIATTTPTSTPLPPLGERQPTVFPDSAPKPELLLSLEVLGFYYIDLSPNGETLAVSGEEGLSLYRMDTTQMVWSVPWDISSAFRFRDGIVDFSSDGTLLASGNIDGFIHIWDVETGQLLRTLWTDPSTPEQHSFSPLMSMAFAPDGSVIAAGAYQHVFIWNAATGEELFRYRESTGTGGFAQAIAFTQDGAMLAAYFTSASIDLWNTQTAERFSVISSPPGSYEALTFIPNSQLLVGVTGGSIAVWNWETGEVESGFEGGFGISSGYDLDVSPDGTILASAEIASVTLWDMATREVLYSLDFYDRVTNKFMDKVTGMSFSPDGEELIIGTSTGAIYRWPVHSRVDLISK